MKAIVTGHSRGLGEALAAELLARDFSVLGLARDGNNRLQRRFPRLQQHQLDLADQMALNAWLQTPALEDFAGRHGPLLLINNAATAGPLGRSGMLGADAVGRALSLNVAAPLMLAERVISVTGGRECRIMHISSGAGTDAYPAWSTYCASKAALDHHARSVALENIPALRIGCVIPGVIDTDMQKGLRGADELHFPLRKAFLDLQSHGHLQSPAECARNLISFLLDVNFGKDAVAQLPAC